MSGAVLSAGDRIRAIVQLGREAREADAECDRIWKSPGIGALAAIDAADARFINAVTAITDHLAALEATGVLEAIAEAADLFEGAGMSEVQDVPMPGPTARLRKVRGMVAAATLADNLMRHGKTPEFRDAATEAYVEAVDAMFAELVALERIGALDELVRLATVTWGRA